MAQVRGQCSPDNEVLTEEAGGNEGQARQRATSDEERPESDGELFAQPTHPKDAVFFIERIDDYARAKKQEGLEKRMGHEVEDSRLPCADDDEEQHVAVL